MQVPRLAAHALSALVFTLLMCAAIAKIHWVATAPPEQDVHTAYLLAIGFETAGATLIVRARTRTTGLRAILGGFAGAGVANAVLLSSQDSVGSCQCLGVATTTQDTALILQGLVVLMCAGALWARSRTVPVDRIS